jgi:TRAP-type uncharacterized transport system fused permease subunit
LRDLALNAVFFAPSILLLLAWGQVVRSRCSDRTVAVSWIPFVVASVSDAYLWLCVAFHGLLGPDYSSLRYNLILANLGAAFVTAAVLCFRRTVARWLLFTASLTLALTWFLVAAVSSAV